MSDGLDRGKGEEGLPGDALAPDADGSSSLKGGSVKAVAPWKKAAIRILLGYLVVHFLALSFLVIYPMLSTLDPEGAVGRMYLDLLEMEIEKVAPWVIAPLLAGTSVASLWGSALRVELRWLLSLSILGVLFTGLFYAEMVWFDKGVDLWQYTGPPNHDEFVALCRNFSAGNLIVFAGALFGALGTQLPGLFGRTAR